MKQAIKAALQLAELSSDPGRDLLQRGRRQVKGQGQLLENPGGDLLESALSGGQRLIGISKGYGSVIIGIIGQVTQPAMSIVIQAVEIRDDLRDLVPPAIDLQGNISKPVAYMTESGANHQEEIADSVPTQIIVEPMTNAICPAV
ncbi:hypothetical protein ES708_29018 [subsurface metagenome]